MDINENDKKIHKKNTHIYIETDNMMRKYEEIFLNIMNDTA